MWEPGGEILLAILSRRYNVQLRVDLELLHVHVEHLLPLQQCWRRSRCGTQAFWSVSVLHVRELKSVLEMSLRATPDF